MHLDKKHRFHYLILLAIVALAVSLTHIFMGNKNAQFIVICAFALVYSVYGILHHSLEHDLTIKIVIEYVLIALLVVSVFLFVRGGV